MLDSSRGGDNELEFEIVNNVSGKLNETTYASIIVDDNSSSTYGPQSTDNKKQQTSKPALNK